VGALLATSVWTSSVLRRGDAVWDRALPANIKSASVPVASGRNVNVVMTNQPFLEQTNLGDAFPCGNANAVRSECATPGKESDSEDGAGRGRARCLDLEGTPGCGPPGGVRAIELKSKRATGAAATGAPWKGKRSAIADPQKPRETLDIPISEHLVRRSHDATVMIRHLVRVVGMKHSHETGTQMVQATTFRIAGMSCGACVRHVTRAVEGMAGVVNVDVDLAKGQAVVEHLPESIDELGLIAAIKDAGYSAAAIDRHAYTDGDDAGRCCCG
jgi:copper chaperone